MRRLATRAGALALAATALAGWSCGRAEWSVDSEAALAAYQRGRQAQMKFYAADAAREYAQALELAPEFVAARIGLLETGRLDRAARERHVAALREADRERLNERERFLVDVLVAAFEGDLERRAAIIADYLERHPRDPQALFLAGGEAWARQDWEVAERHYARLLEIDPNWVVARNNLGYIAMAQGRFAEAEEQFETYRYAAPDQANPHDSLGELYVLVGRYDEARAELERALEVRPDFCASYGNLFRLAILERRPEELAKIVERTAEHCEPEMTAELRCLAPAAESFLGGDPQAPWRLEGCEEVFAKPDLLTHFAALRGGRRELALEMEAKVGAQAAKVEEYGDRHLKNLRALELLLEGQRLLYEGEPAAAAAKLREVEADSTWWGAGGSAVLKLAARAMLAEALAAAGDETAAEVARARLRAVNPAFARDFANLPVAPPRPQA